MIQSVAVLGAGTMGIGIARVFASTGHDTMLYDVNPTAADEAVEKISTDLDGLAAKGKITPEQSRETKKRLSVVRDPGQLKADLIIEAVVENLEVKQSLFSELEKINSAEAIFATNTSSLSVTEIGRVLKEPSRCIGIHFFNPATVMKLVEIVVTSHTSDWTLAAAQALIKKIGKTGVVAKDSPGFIVNRVARLFYVESLRILEEQGATVESIDSLMRSAGFKMGPFELMDLIGVDTNLAVTKSVYHAFHDDSKFKPSPIQQKLVDEGHWGRKSGKGFYDYQVKNTSKNKLSG